MIDFRALQLVAGTLSTLLFVSSSVPMLAKAVVTKDLRSYSLTNLVLTNVANVVHWLYVSQLPSGPIWLLHAFYTLTSTLMLFWYLRYRHLHLAPS